MAYQFQDFVTPYVDPLRAQSAQILNKRYTDYFAADSELEQYLADLQAATFDADQQRANQMRSKYGANLQQRVTRGDYENLGSAIMMDARNFINEYTPLKANYLAQATFAQDLQKQAAEGTITGETAALAMQRDIYNYNQAAQAKGVHQYVPGTVVEDIPNLVKYFEDNYLDGYIKRNYEEDTTYFTEDGVYKVRTKEGISDYIPDSDLQLMYNNMLADPKVQSYLTQYADLRTFNLDDQEVARRQSMAASNLTSMYNEMYARYETMRPTADRAALVEQMATVKKQLDQIKNSDPEDFRNLIKQGLVEEIISPAEQTIVAKYAGERNVKKLVEQAYNPLYLKRVDHELNLARMHQRFLYDLALKDYDAQLDAQGDLEEEQANLTELRDLFGRSSVEQGNEAYLQSTASEALASEDQLSLMFAEGYDNLLESLSQFDQSFGETSQISGTFYTTAGQPAGNSIENLPDGAYLVDRGNGQVEQVAIMGGRVMGGQDAKPVADPTVDSPDQVMLYASKNVEEVFSVDPNTIEDPIKRNQLVELQKNVASQYNNLAVSSSVLKEFTAIEAQIEEEFLLRDAELKEVLEMGRTATDSPLFQTGPGGAASPTDVSNFLRTSLMAVANGMDVYVANGPDVSRVSPDGRVKEGIAYTDIPGYTEADVISTEKDSDVSVIVPGISQRTTGEGKTASQLQTLRNLEGSADGLMSVVTELHKAGDFYGRVAFSPSAVRNYFVDQVGGAVNERVAALEQTVSERTQKKQQDFITDFFTKGTNLGGVEGLVPPTEIAEGAKGALTNTKAYEKYLKAPLPSQRAYELFDPSLNSTVGEYQLFYENGEFNVNLVDEQGNKLPPSTMAEFFSINENTGKVDAYMVPGSLRSEVQIPPINKRGISAIYRAKGETSGGKRLFIPYEQLPATLPQIKERLYNEGLQYVAQRWNQSMMMGREMDLVLNPVLQGKPIDVQTEDGNFIFAGKVRFSPMQGKVYYLDASNNPIPGSGKDYHEWAASLDKNTLNIIDLYFNK